MPSYRASAADAQDVGRAFGARAAHLAMWEEGRSGRAQGGARPASPQIKSLQFPDGHKLDPFGTWAKGAEYEERGFPPFWCCGGGLG